MRLIFDFDRVAQESATLRGPAAGSRQEIRDRFSIVPFIGGTACLLGKASLNSTNCPLGTWRKSAKIW